MAVRKPLYETGGNLREMDTTMVDELVDQAVYQYSLSLVLYYRLFHLVDR